VTTEDTAELPVSYIVRVYRSGPPEAMAGTVDVPELAKHLTFASFEELKTILTTANGRER
jgi:hypothetical protein